MTRKSNKRIEGACRLLRLVGVAVAIIGMLSGCADTESETTASDLNNQTQYSFQASTDCQAAQTAADRAACATVLHLLKQALTDQVQLSDEDVKKLELKPNDFHVADINEAIENCNDNDYEQVYSGALWETAETYCDRLGETVWPMSSMTSTDPGLGPDSPAAEITFARACALPIIGGVREVAGGCANLSRLFEFRHQPELALAIVEYAPKCQGRPRAEPEIHPIDYVEDSANSQREICLWQESYVLRDMGRPQAAKFVYKILCDAAVEEACSDFADMGGQVNMKAVEERQASLQAAAQSRADADSAAHAQAQAERDADEQNLLNALHSLPGGSDPNAIIDSASQQAANIDALGATDNAIQRRAAEQPREQSSAQPVSATSGLSLNSANSRTALTSGDDHKLDYKVTYTEPAMNCLVYAAPGPYEGAGVWVTNSCSYEIMINWATPSAPASGMTYLDAGDKIFIEEKPVKVFACKVIKRNDKDALANMGINKPFDPALNQWVLPTYDDPSFVCPLYPEAP